MNILKKGWSYAYLWSIAYTHTHTRRYIDIRIDEDNFSSNVYRFLNDKAGVFLHYVIVKLFAWVKSKMQDETISSEKWKLFKTIGSTV